MIGSIIFGLLVGVSVYIITKKIYQSHSQTIIEQAKAKAKAIEYEAKKLLQEHQMTIKEEELYLKQHYEQERDKLVRKYDTKSAHLQKEMQEIAELKAKVLRSQTELNKLINENKHNKKEMLQILSKYTRMSREEAPSI